MNIRLAALCILLLGSGCPKQAPVAAVSDAEASSEGAQGETTVLVEVAGEVVPTSAVPTFGFDWPREGRLAVELTQTVERSGADAGLQTSVETTTSTWTLAGSDNGELRMAATAPARSLHVAADGRLLGAGSDAEAAMWDRLVGHWVGRPGATGSTFEERGSLGVAGFEDVSAEALLRSVVTGRVPCRGQSRDLRCVELEVRGELDEEGRKALLVELQAREHDGRSLRDLEVLEHATLRTVGSSLQPARLEVERITRLRFRGNEGEEETERTRESRVYVFDWTR